MSDAPLMLGVSGLRGLVGRSLTPIVAARYGAAVGGWFRSQRRGGDAGPPHVVVGRDSRPSGQMLELATVAGLVAVGCRVTRLGIVTTPGVAIMTEHLGADGGIVITASHNPIEWNGIKTLRHDGVAPPPDQAADIVVRFKRDEPAWAVVDDLMPVQENETSHSVHVDRVLAHVDVAAIRRRRPKVVLDSVNGAGGPVTKLLLDALGVELVHLNAEPTGRFPHRPEPLRENLTDLCEAVRRHGADAGFAQDPDADRLVVVDERGRYIGEEYTLALAVLHVLQKVVGERGGEAGRGGPLTVAANLSTSRMIDDVAGRFNVRVQRTPVGEANVAAAIRATGAIVGGEGNGGVIWPKVILVRDSLVGIALVLEMLASQDAKLSDWVARIPAYAIVKDKLAIAPGVMEGVPDALRGAFADAKCNLDDGVRMDWPDRWVHVRASNTEPILRIIAEAPDEAEARRLIGQVKRTLGLDQV
jgi:phosphomannomutase